MEPNDPRRETRTACTADGNRTFQKHRPAHPRKKGSHGRPLTWDMSTEKGQEYVRNVGEDSRGLPYQEREKGKIKVTIGTI